MCIRDSPRRVHPNPNWQTTFPRFRGIGLPNWKCRHEHKRLWTVCCDFRPANIPKSRRNLRPYIPAGFRPHRVRWLRHRWRRDNPSCFVRHNRRWFVPTIPCRSRERRAGWVQLRYNRLQPSVGNSIGTTRTGSPYSAAHPGNCLLYTSRCV